MDSGDPVMFKTVPGFLEAAEKAQKEALAILEAKAPVYGLDSWQSLGERSLFCEIHQKYSRVKSVIWDGVKPDSSEALDDTLLDMANYAIMMLIYLRRKEGRTDK